MLEFILMDLDGTITNPKLGITKSVQYALQSKGILIDDLDSLCKFIGPPLKDSFMDFYDFSEEDAKVLIEKYREYFKDTGIYENEMYEGMEELLGRLMKAGYKIVTATSKPEVFARRILEHFHLDQFFYDICGATLDGSRATKEEVIRYALEKNKITDLTKIVMVGDREHDIIGAKQVGIACIGVLYGFGSRRELVASGADKLVPSIEELFDVIAAM